MTQEVESAGTNPRWYREAIIYQAHVHAFFDSTSDGVGDFPGLTSRLGYLEDLGIDTLWLLPFYPSPLKDDGYDIADYENVHPAYGTIDDFDRLIEAAHRRRIRVITELVINHTSDQHPWFQAARRAPAGSPARDFYVWSHTNLKYQGARIIFSDTETSNWTWDDAAGAYYWHRFFHHQPDLNYDNPAVLEAVVQVMHFWLDRGVDGLRLDAVPYLIERDGTPCENLEETHSVLKRIRAAMDARYADRVLLAEANQWPAEVRPYFGDGDECHMAFNFPLMPRMFMAVRQEDRYPIVEILRQTPEIPESCQWGLFLRNHDELTLEMVTDEERDYMYQTYATDPQMRINDGIRRRLAPLMENSRRRIELMTSLLFSLPGTPVIYYGDEIGMGDNIYLGDRNSVRTPMQWTGDRNGGFSRADAARLYAPVISDPVYGFTAVNVEAQERAPFSLLNWMKRMITLRKQHAVFGRGEIEFVPSPNRKVLAYVRRDTSDTILCVANLSRSVQPVELDLSRFQGMIPVEMLGQTEFPRIGQQPYFLSLGAYAFTWFRLLQTAPSTTERTTPETTSIADLPPLFVGAVWDTLLDGSVRALIERDLLGPFLQRQPWFQGDRPKSVRFKDWGLLLRGPEPIFLTIVEAELDDPSEERDATVTRLYFRSARPRIGREREADSGEGSPRRACTCHRGAQGCYLRRVVRHALCRTPARGGRWSRGGPPNEARLRHHREAHSGRGRPRHGAGRTAHAQTVSSCRTGRASGNRDHRASLSGSIHARSVDRRDGRLRAIGWPTELDRHVHRRPANRRSGGRVDARHRLVGPAVRSGESYRTACGRAGAARRQCAAACAGGRFDRPLSRDCRASRPPDRRHAHRARG